MIPQQKQPLDTAEDFEKAVLFSAEDMGSVTTGAIIHPGQRYIKDYGEMRRYILAGITSGPCFGDVSINVLFSYSHFFFQSFHHRRNKRKQNPL